MQNAQRSDAMDEIDTSLIDPAYPGVADMEDNMAFAQLLDQTTVPEETRWDVGLDLGNGGPGLRDFTTGPMSTQPGSVTPAAISYPFPRSYNEGNPGVGMPTNFADHWQALLMVESQRRAAASAIQATGSQHIRPPRQSQAPRVVPPPGGYSFPASYVGVPRRTDAAPENANRPTDTNTSAVRPYSMLTLRNPLDQHDRATLEGRRVHRYHIQRRIRRHRNRGESTPKRLDDMNDGRPEAKEASDLTVKLDCKICMTQLVDTVVIPCGHAVMCRWCAELHVPPTGSDSTRPGEFVQCPICRSPIERKFRIFLS